MPGSGAPQDPDDGDVPREDAAPADADGEAGDAPDPALVTEITGRIAQIKAAADAAATVLTASGDLHAALAGLDEIYEQAAQARRALKAATRRPEGPGRPPRRAARQGAGPPGRPPGGEFTPHEIHKVLGHSSGAIANALDTLVKLGDAELATEKPRRFRRAAQPRRSRPRSADSAARTAPNWRVPRDDPRPRPGRQHAAPAPRPASP